MVVLSTKEITVLKMPENIYLSCTCIDYILKMFKNIDDTKKNIVLDFSSTNWIDAEVTPFLGVLVKKCQNEGFTVFSKLPENPLVVKILEKNGFLFTYGLSKKTEDIFGTTIPYTVLNSHDDVQIDVFLENRVFHLIHKHINENEIEIIRDAVNEISHNVKDHSNESLVYFCGQFYPSKKYISLTLTDNGITIPNKIKHKFKTKSDQLDSELIEWATGHGHSTKNLASSGLGLFDIKKNIYGIGEMIIISNYGFWKQDSNGCVIHQTLKNPYPGTLINLKFLTYDHKKRVSQFEHGIINVNTNLFF